MAENEIRHWRPNTQHPEKLMTTQLDRKFWPAITTLSLIAGGALSVGCKVNPTNPSMENSSAGRACKSPEALICDSDDNDNQSAVAGGRGGYWYTFSDMLGTEVWPLQGAKGGTFEMTPGGAENSPYAAHFKGQVVASDQPTQAGMGVNFVDPKGAYDASQYGGISFWAKAGPGSVTSIRLKVPDSLTDPDAGNCSECFNDFGMDLMLSNEWQKYIIPFNKLTQLPGWGKPRGFSVNTSEIFGLQFQVNVAGKPFDIWVDQIRFTGCAE
jgi:endoglucanase